MLRTILRGLREPTNGEGKPQASGTGYTPLSRTASIPWNPGSLNTSHLKAGNKKKKILLWPFAWSLRQKVDCYPWSATQTKSVERKWCYLLLLSKRTTDINLFHKILENCILNRLCKTTTAWSGTSQYAWSSGRPCTVLHLSYIRDSLLRFQNEGQTCPILFGMNLREIHNSAWLKKKKILLNF